MNRFPRLFINSKQYSISLCGHWVYTGLLRFVGMLLVVEVAFIESTGPLWSVSILQAPVIVVLVAVTSHGYSEIDFYHFVYSKRNSI